MLGVLALQGRPIFVLLGLTKNCIDICVWHGLLPCFIYVGYAINRSCYYIHPSFCVNCLQFLFLSRFTMPRTLARLQHKRPQGKATTGPTSKQPGQNQQPSQFTNFQSVRSAVTSDDLISRLADTVTQCRRQENRPSLTARQSADTPVMEIPATLPSTPPCLLRDRKSVV